MPSMSMSTPVPRKSLEMINQIHFIYVVLYKNYKWVGTYCILSQVADDPFGKTDCSTHGIDWLVILWILSIHNKFYSFLFLAIFLSVLKYCKGIPPQKIWKSTTLFSRRADISHSSHSLATCCLCDRRCSQQGEGKPTVNCDASR